MSDGFEVPLHRSLTEPILLAGVPRKIAILNGTMIAAFGLGLHSFWSIVFGVVLHFALVAFARKDPQVFDIFPAFLKEKDRLEI